MLKSSLDALKRRTGRVTARLRGLPHPSRFSKGGDHAPPRFIRHIAARIALIACSHAEAPSSLLRIRILALHHSSCYQRRPLLNTPRRRTWFLEILEQVRRRYTFVVVGYVVMPEHFHLLISEPEREILLP